jgi:hypothetical protein
LFLSSPIYLLLPQVYSPFTVNITNKSTGHWLPNACGKKLYYTCLKSGSARGGSNLILVHIYPKSKEFQHEQKTTLLANISFKDTYIKGVIASWSC